MEENKNVSQNSNDSSTAKKPNSTLLIAVAAAAVVVIVAIVMVILLSGGKKCEHIDADDNLLCDLCGEAFDDGKAETPGDGKINYTVTVVNTDGTAVKGAKVTFITSSMEVPFTTDANGKVSYKSADTIKVKVTSVPTGYTYAKLNVEQSFNSEGALTVTLEKLDLPDWTIRVVDQDGNPIEGVSVQMCADTCLIPRSTDADGYVIYEDYEGDFHAMISTLPAEYSEGEGDGFDEVQGKPYYNFNSDNLAVITLTRK